MAWFIRCFVLLCTLVLAGPASAHPVPFSYLDVKVQKSPWVDVSLVVHIFDVAHDLGIKPMEQLLQPAVVAARESDIRMLILPRLKLEADGQPVNAEWLGTPEILADRQSLRLRMRYAVASPPGLVAVDTLMFPYDKEHQTFVNMYEEDDLTSQYILDDDHTRTEYFAGTRQGAFAVVKKFIPSGIHHILIGPDHLLFLVGLLLLGGSLRQLLLVVTAFTVGHSVTLSLAALDILTPPASIIEPAIALSIVYVGADNLLAQGGRDVRAWIALAFGFIHGFGFANVLREMGLPSRALGWSLFSFNFGVEIGQVMVVVVVATTFAFLRARSAWAGRHLASAGSIVVIIAGAYWFVERVFFPQGLL
jgi:hydrogenase/urease accessory protein HupE